MPGLDTGWLSRSHSSARGAMFPQPWLIAGEAGKQRMDEVVGYGWLLVIADVSLPTPAARHRLGVVRIGEGGHREADGVVHTWMNKNRCSAALVRPDHYVFGVASSEPELDGLLDDWETSLGIESRQDEERSFSPR
jgi:3-(3-hydroxy-phenyl)propionate hydroxylase